MYRNAQKVLIADGDEVLARSLSDRLKGTDLRLCAVAREGGEAVEEYFRYFPALMVVSAELPGVDGFGVIERLRGKGERMAVIMTSSAPGEFIREKARSLGVSYLFTRPVDAALLIRRMEEVCARGAGNADAAALATICLNSLCIYPNVSGFELLRFAIVEVARHPALLDNVMTGLYPMAGERFKKSVCAVERGMRRAVEAAFKNADPGLLENMFGYSVDERKGKPANREFIALVADRIRTRLSIME